MFQLDGTRPEDAPSDVSADVPTDSLCPGVALASDPDNCGACGHQCGDGAACVDQACQPQVIAANQLGASHLAVNTTHLFWNAADEGAIRRRPTGVIDPSPFETILSTAMTPTDVQVDDQRVYFTAANGIFHCDQAGCVTASLRMTCTQGPPGEVGLNSTTVFSTCPFSKLVQAIGKEAPAANSVTFANSQNGLGSIVADAADAFWVEAGTTGQIRRRILSDGSTSNLPAAGVQHLALTASHLFWTTQTSIIRANRSNLASVVFADNQAPTAIAIHDSIVYWVGGGAGAGYLRACPVASCSADEIVELMTTLDAPIEVEVDDNFYYVIDGDPAARSIKRLRRR